MTTASATRRSIPLSKQIAWRQVIIFSLTHIAALLTVLFFPSWQGLMVLILGHFLTGCLGITLGYHRLLTHKAFRARPWLRTCLAGLGTLALQGGPLSWAALHRAHHRRENAPGDPHAASRGFLWSHFAWVFFKAPNGFRFRQLQKQVPDLAALPDLQWFEKNSLRLNVMVFALAFVILGGPLALWAFPLRIVIVWHCTWMVNSLAHSAKPILHDEQTGVSKNLQWLAWLTYGEGLHANHHKRPGRAKFSEWRQYDPGFLVLRAFAALRCVQLHP